MVMNALCPDRRPPGDVLASRRVLYPCSFACLCVLVTVLLVPARIVWADPVASDAWSVGRVSAWQGWARLGGKLVGSPALAYDVDRDRLHLAAPGPEGALLHSRREGEDWAPVVTLEAGSTRTPALAVDPAGVLHLVVTRDDGTVAHNRFVDGRWSGFAELGVRSVLPPALAFNLFGQAMELVVVTPGGALLHNRFARGRWETWRAVGAAAGQTPAIGTSFQGAAFDLIYSALDGALFHHGFALPDGWRSAFHLGAVTPHRPALAVGPTGGLEVAIAAPDGDVWHSRRVAGRWLGWQSLGQRAASAPALVYNTDADTLELAVTTPEGGIAHNRFLNGAWTRWWPLGGASTDAPALVQGADGDLELAVAAGDGSPRLNRFRPRTPALISFADAIRPLFDAHCTSCHEGPRPPMDLNLTASWAYGMAVNVASGQLRRLRRVTPGAPEQSYLYLKLTGTHLAVGGSGTPMPPGSPLSPDEIARVRDWIAQGALRN